MKRHGRLFFTLIIVIILIPVAAAIALQFPAVQTAAVNKAAELLSEKLDGEVTVGKVYLSIPNNLILKDVNAIYGERDTVASVGKLLVNLKAASLLTEELAVKRVSLEDGCFRLRKTDSATTNLSALIAPLLDPDKEKDTASVSPFKSYRLDRLTVKNFNFSTEDRFADSISFSSPHQIDWSNIGLEEINLDARHLKYEDSLSVSIEKLTFKESRGMEVNHFSGDVSMSDNLIIIRSLDYDDGLSHILADSFSLGFDSFDDFSDFLNKVRLDGDFNGTTFDFRSLDYFAGLDYMTLRLGLDGRVYGTVADLRSQHIDVTSDTGVTDLGVAFQLKGLPDFLNTYAKIKVDGGKTSVADVARILEEVSPDINTSSFSKFAPGTVFNLNADMDGLFSNFKSKVSLQAPDMGSVEADGTFKCGNGGKIDAAVRTNGFQTGRFLLIDSIGALTCSADASVFIGRHGTDVTVAPLEIGSFRFKGYDYHDISAVARMADSRIEADIVSKDPNISFAANAQAETGKSDGDLYLADIDIYNLNLNELHFDSHENTHISLDIDADITRNPQNEFFGRATIRNAAAVLEGRSLDVGDLTLTSDLVGGEYLLAVNSDLADISYSGDSFITDFINELTRKSLKENLDNLFETEGAEPDTTIEHCRMDITTRNLQPALEFIMPELYVAGNSKVSLALRDGEAYGTVKSPVLALGDLYVKDIAGDIFTRDSSLNAKVAAVKLESGSLMAENAEVTAALRDNVLNLKAAFRNSDSKELAVDFNTIATFNTPGSLHDISAAILPSTIELAGDTWKIDPAGVNYGDKNIAISGFRLHNGEQSISIDGVIGESTSDTVRVDLKDFDVSVANAFLGEGINLEGTFNGFAGSVALMGEEKGLLLDLKGDGIAVSGHQVGDITIRSRWNEEAKQFDILATDKIEGETPLRLAGFYRPSDKNFRIRAGLDRFGLGFASPFLTGVLSDMTGAISGDIVVSGTPDNIAIKGEKTRADSLGFVVDFTKVKYIVDGPITIDDKSVAFNRARVFDKYGNSGLVTGGLLHENFKNMRLDLRINIDDMLALNTGARDNSSFYGKAFATGSVRISGPFDNLKLNIRAATNEGSSVHIPLGGGSMEGQASLLTFIGNEEKMDLYDSLKTANVVKVQEKKGSSQLGLTLNLTATPDAEIQIEINKETGDILKARGNGAIGITIDENHPFDIKGDYEISEGSYNFSLMGIVSRVFSINPGGTIAFTGDIMKSDLDLTANYRTKAAIGTLIADSTTVNTRRIVDCGIGIGGKLENPEISFSIDIPDLDPTTQSKVESALNTEDKRMKQVLALLVSGGFVPNEESGIVNSTTVLYSNASEIMANQLNNIFRQLEIPLDLGFNYQPSENGHDIFDVAVSTQLFNNRVSINGNIGNRQYMTTGGQSEVVGDIDIEIKLTKTGQLRLTLFSHSADQYSNYLDQSQRNGAGIIYQQEFNTVRELWRKIFHFKSDERQTVFDPNTVRRISGGEGPALRGPGTAPVN